MSRKELFVLSVILTVALGFHHDFEKLYRSSTNRMVDFSIYKSPENEKYNAFWKADGQNFLRKKIMESQIYNKAKNAIIFLGDGMGVGTTTATRVFKAQNKGQRFGEEESLSFDQFPFSGLSRTYCTNAQVPDSACTATAYLGGVKTNIALLGVNSNVPFKNCTAANDPANQVESIMAWAQRSGKATGIVTTTTVSHASPGAAYAHVANRMWQSDSDVLADGEDPVVCKDIASQLIHSFPGKNFDVIFGGGRTNFLPKRTFDETNAEGLRSDGRNLINQWKAYHPEGTYITNRDQLLSLPINNTKRVLGLFHAQDLDFHQYSDKAYQPTLEEMTEAAIKVLSRNQNGYVLFVEGGRIDHGNHFTRAHLALDECNEFDKAIENAAKRTNPYETLTVVTSDHSHPVSVAGYGPRGNDVLGLVEGMSDLNGHGFAVLNYPVGPDQYIGKDIKQEFTDRLEFPSPSYINSFIGNHGGDDVSVYAKGPYSHLFTGSMEQNEIPHKIAYALCIGNGLKVCK
ncbi:hypothetical protein ACFFRR_006025 [Megaselia abdita]